MGQAKYNSGSQRCMGLRTERSRITPTSSAVAAALFALFVWLPVPLIPCDAAEPDSTTETRSAAIVVCPADFRDALAPWIDYRRQQGFSITVIESGPDAAGLADSIRTTATGDDRYLLLIGDAPVIGSEPQPSRQVPMHYVPTTVSGRFGSTPTLATDYPYGDIDGDGRTDLAVGRIPVSSADQLRQMIDRIKAYEDSRDFSRWRQQVQLVGGVGGFGMLADTAIESVTRIIVTASLPTSVRTSVAYGSPGHLFYPRQRFTESVTRRYSQGCRFWVYAGHGRVDQLDRVPSGPTGVPVLDSDSVNRLQCDPANAPIALLLCCFTGAIDASVDSFAERLLMHRCGPIAVIAGNRVTMPYGNAALSLGLIDSIYGQGTPHHAPALRLGDAWRDAIHRLESDEPPADGSTDPVSQTAETGQLQFLIDTVAKLVSPAGTKLVDERNEHAALYALLGDPMLHLHPPAPVTVETDAGFDFASPIKINVTSPIDGECIVMLDYPLGEKRFDPSGEIIDPNELTIAQATEPVTAGQPKSFSITVDDQRSGVVAIRVHVAGSQTWAAGAGQTFVRPKTRSELTEQP